MIEFFCIKENLLSILTLINNLKADSFEKIS